MTFRDFWGLLGNLGDFWWLWVTFGKYIYDKLSVDWLRGTLGDSWGLWGTFWQLWGIFVKVNEFWGLFWIRR